MRVSEAGKAVEAAVAVSPPPATGAGDGVARAPADADDAPERFIPVSPFALEHRLFRARGWSGTEAAAWRRALHCLGAWRHQDYRHRLRTLLERYLPFSPDRDTVRLLEYTPDELAEARATLIAGVEDLLLRANYTRLSETDLERLLLERSPYGLRLDVDLAEYEHLLLYYRGSDVETREERDPWRAYRRVRYTVPVFKRLFLLVKLKSEERRLREIARDRGVDPERARRVLRRLRAHLPSRVSSDHVYMKVFKNIPQVDLEMLFPNTKVAFRPFDKLRLLVTAGGGTAAGVMGSATKLMAAANPFALAGAVAGLCALVFRQVAKFFHTRDRYMMELAQNLYFHNLANNRGALTLLVDRAEEEDVKEDMLLYAWLAGRPVARADLPGVKTAIETFLRQDCGVRVAFDAEEALGRLIGDGVAVEQADGLVHALPPEAASRHIDAMWDRLLDEDRLDLVVDAPRLGR